MLCMMITKIKLLILYDWCLQELLGSYDDRIIEIIPGWELTAEQMAIIGEKFLKI